MYCSSHYTNMHITQSCMYPLGSLKASCSSLSFST